MLLMPQRESDDFVTFKTKQNAFINIFFNFINEVSENRIVPVTNNYRETYTNTIYFNSLNKYINFFNLVNSNYCSIIHNISKDNNISINNNDTNTFDW